MTATADRRPRPRGGLGTTEGPAPAFAPHAEVSRIFLVPTMADRHIKRKGRKLRRGGVDWTWNADEGRWELGAGNWWRGSIYE